MLLLDLQNSDLHYLEFWDFNQKRLLWQIKNFLIQLILVRKITIDEPLDISLVRITQNTPVRNTQEMPALTKNKTEKNEESESVISDIEDYINKKCNYL